MWQIDKRLLARRFGRRAATYDAVTPVQGHMAGLLLDEVSRRLSGRRIQRILELGCGTGRLTHLLSQRFPSAHIVAIDLAPAMIERARSRCVRAEFISADAETFARQVHPGVDLIISNAAVQWFEHPGRTLTAYRALLASDGCLALTTFGEQTFRELRRAMTAAYGRGGQEAAQRHLLSLAPASFWQDIFPDAQICEQILTDRHPDVRSFLRSLQRAGVTYAGRRRQVLPLPVLRRIMTLYPGVDAAPPAPGIVASYHVISLFVEGPHPRRTAGSSPLDDHRRDASSPLPMSPKTVD